PDGKLGRGFGQPLPRGEQDRLHRPAAAGHGHRDRGQGRPDQGAAGGRGGRADPERAADDAGLLAARQQRRVRERPAAHRRHRLHGQGRLHLHHRPDEGHGGGGRLQGLPPHAGGIALSAPGGAGGDRDRHSRRLSRPAPQGVRGAEARTGGHGGRRGPEGVAERQGGQARAGGRRGGAREPAQDHGGQTLEKGTGGGRNGQAGRRRRAGGGRPDTRPNGKPEPGAT